MQVQGNKSYATSYGLTFLGILVSLSFLTSCSKQTEVHFFTADNYPATLSQWGLFEQSHNRLSPHNSTHVYSLNTALFSDYAHKLRTVYVPKGKTLNYQEFEAFNAPVGTIISKTFFYPINQKDQVQLTNDLDHQQINLAQNRLIETRLLIRQDHGWDALPYIWKDGDGHLAITGDLISLSTNSEPLNYLVPSKNQCASCHATDHTKGDVLPIGLKARHLNRPTINGADNQLMHWAASGLLTNLPTLADVPKNANLMQPGDLEHKARTYLDINCGHCHNPTGAADTSGLLLDYQPHREDLLGVCKPPIAAGRGSGGKLYSIVPGHADESILSFRMTTNDPGSMMPELGRSLVHTEGVELINKWINSMPQNPCL